MGSVREFLGSWVLSWPWLVSLSGVTLAYLAGARTIATRAPDRPWPKSRTSLFVAALVTAILAVMGPIGSQTERFLWADMSEHILLMMLAAPLFVLSDPVLLLLRAASPAVRRRAIVPVLRSRYTMWITHPAVGWVVFTAALTATHLVPVFNLALERSALRTVALPALYLTAGLIYYYPLIGRSLGAMPIAPHVKILSMFTMMIPEAILGFVIYSSTSVLYPYYESVSDRPWGPSTALLDQQVAGAVMWGAGMVLDSIWISVVVAQWWKQEERSARRIDDSIPVTITPAQDS